MIKSNNRKILLIEKLSPANLAYAFIFRPAYSSIYFCTELKLMRNQTFILGLEKFFIYKIKLKGFHVKGLHYQMQAKSIDIGERFFSELIKTHKGYLRLTRFLQLNAESFRKFDHAVKFNLANHYHDAVKTLGTAELMGKDNIVECIFDSAFELLSLYPPGNYRRLYIGRVLYEIKNAFSLLLSSSLALLKLILRRSPATFSDNNSPLDGTGYEIGTFPFKNSYAHDGQLKRFYFNTVIYDYHPGSLLNPSKILHLFTADVTDEMTLEFLNRRHIPFVNVYKFPLGRTFLFDLIKCFLKFLVRPIGCCGLNFMSLAYEFIFWRHLFRKLDSINVYYVSYDSLFSKIAVAAMSFVNKVSVSSIYASGHVGIIDSYLTYDYMGIFSSKYSDIINSHKALIGNYFVCGVTRSDIVYGFNKAKFISRGINELKKKYTLVVAVDFGSFKDIFDEESLSEYVVDFYQALLSLLERYPNIYIISKLRAASSLDYYKTFPDNPLFFEKILSHPRLRLECFEDTYKLLSCADIVISNNLSTAGIEAVAAHKKVLFFDLTHCPAHGFSEYGIVANSQDDLLNKFDTIYKGRPDFNWNQIHLSHCGGYFDGKCRNRIKRNLIEIMETRRAGMPVTFL